VSNELTLDRIQEAARFLSGRIRRTPVEPSPALSTKLGVPIWFKLEALQITGSFKIRGAFFRLSHLTERERRTGIVTCSAGNHGKACAFAGRELGVRTMIYVPSTIDEAKYRGMIALGAEVIVSNFPGFDQTEELAQEEARKSGTPFVSAFDDCDVMAGNGGTLAAEVIADLPQATNFICPIGGGGLGAGFSLYVKEKVMNARFIGCQHEASPAFTMSLEQGRAITRLDCRETLAAGIEGGIGARTFDILRSRVDQVALVSDLEICAAVRWMIEEHQYLIEPTAAAPLAACLNGRVGKLSGPTVVIVTGRNVSFKTTKKVLSS
jgi:threonine dehydratase